MVHAETPMMDASGAPVSPAQLSPDDRVIGAASGGQAKASPILTIFSRATSETVEILAAGGGRVTCTSEHEIGIPARGRRKWRKASGINPGDPVICEMAGTIIHDRVASVLRSHTPRPTYFVSLTTKRGNAFCGGILCRA